MARFFFLLGIYFVFSIVPKGKDEDLDSESPHSAAAVRIPDQRNDSIPLDAKIQAFPTTNRSKDQWIKWFEEVASFRINRETEDYLFDCNAQAILQTGMTEPAYEKIYSRLNQILGRLWPNVDANADREELLRMGILTNDMLPTEISRNDNSSTLLYRAEVPVSGVHQISIINRATSFKQEMQDFFQHQHTGKKIGPEFAEALVEWCLSQPIFRNFGNSELLVSIEDTQSEGHQVFRITEQLLNKDGRASIVKEFTSEELPAPYNRILKVESMVQ